jgi:hypothetical protein
VSKELVLVASLYVSSPNCENKEGIKCERSRQKIAMWIGKIEENSTTDRPNVCSMFSFFSFSFSSSFLFSLFFCFATSA